MQFFMPEKYRAVRESLIEAERQRAWQTPRKANHVGTRPAEPGLYARTKSAPSTMTDQIHVGVPYVVPSSRNGEMCRSSASAILRSSSFDHVIECLLINFPFLLAPQSQPRIRSPSARITTSLEGRD